MFRFTLYYLVIVCITYLLVVFRMYDVIPLSVSCRRGISDFNCSECTTSFSWDAMCEVSHVGSQITVQYGPCLFAWVSILKIYYHIINCLLTCLFTHHQFILPAYSLVWIIYYNVCSLVCIANLLFHLLLFVVIIDHCFVYAYPFIHWCEPFTIDLLSVYQFIHLCESHIIMFCSECTKSFL